MRQSIFLTAFVFALPVLLVSQASEESRQKKILPIKPVTQEAQMWCWAASAQMILGYLGEPVRQCDQVTLRMQESDCCGLVAAERSTLSKAEKRARRDCKRLGGWPDFERFGFEFKATDSTVALTWEQLKSEIDNDRPVMFAVSNRGGGEHMMVVIGYSAPNLVHINDPYPINGDFNKKAPDFVVMPYKKYVSNAKYTHYKDIYDIHRKLPVTLPETQMTTTAPHPTSPVQEQTEPLPALVDNSPSVGMADQVDGDEVPPEHEDFVAYDRAPEPIGGMRAIQRALKYPANARLNRIEGRVIVNAKINRAGEVAATKIRDSAGYESLDIAAQAAVASVRWKPAMQRDTAVSVWIRVPVNFKLD